MRRVPTLPAAAALILVAASFGLAAGGAQSPSATTHRQLLIVLDGLRPDYVTPDLMPNLYALGQRGVVFGNHHSVYPTVTRVNAASISTGAYPGAHGLIGNSVFFPEVDPRRFLDTSDRANLLAIDQATRGALLTAPTLGEMLQASGRRLLSVGSGSAGSATLLNHKVSGGAILHVEFAAPEGLYLEMAAKFGPLTGETTPNDTRNRRAVDTFLQIGLPRVNPDVTMMWLSDPDATAHAYGIGHLITKDALKRVDAELKRLQDGLAAAGLLDRYDIWVTSDHGFSTSTSGTNLNELLAPFAGTLPDKSPRLVTGGGAIYVRDHDGKSIAGIVGALQGASTVGAIFVPAAGSGNTGNLDGRLPGTLSFDAIRWSHARSSDILFSPNWTDRNNEHGVPGTSASGGVATHGSSSPFDMHNVLIAAGPSLKTKASVGAPSGNVDFAPTFLHLMGIEIPRSMEGRVLEEALTGGPNPSSQTVESTTHTVRNADGSYTLTATFSTVTSARGRFRYLDYTKVERP